MGGLLMGVNGGGLIFWSLLLCGFGGLWTGLGGGFCECEGDPVSC